MKTYIYGNIHLHVSNNAKCWFKPPYWCNNDVQKAQFFLYNFSAPPPPQLGIVIDLSFDFIYLNLFLQLILQVSISQFREHSVSKRIMILG